jgi:hypothetical protein
MEQDNKLEEEFVKAVEETQLEIKKYLDEAKAALAKAVEVSEKNGIPFESTIYSWCSRVYTPVSLSEKWEELDRQDEDRFSELLEECGFNGCPDTGWEHWNSSSLFC